MPSTSTKYISFETLASRGASATTLIQLMMACNDMALANQSLTEWQNLQSKLKQSQQQGAKMYFIRIQLAHLHEGFKVIDAINKDPILIAHLSRCDTRTKRSFQNLLSFIPGGNNRKEFDQLIGRLRHNLTFHYDESGVMITKAIQERASHLETRQSSITRGSTAHLWRFKVADDVIDSVVVRQIWKVPRNHNEQIELDRIAVRVHQIFYGLLIFLENLFGNIAKHNQIISVRCTKTINLEMYHHHNLLQ